jgi:hypothetical protein
MKGAKCMPTCDKRDALWIKKERSIQPTFRGMKKLKFELKSVFLNLSH